MATEWQQFLLTQGFEINHPTPAQLKQRPLNEQAKIIDLSHWSLMSITGDDASDFLQGQLSNDLTALSADQPHQLNAYCNPKGRMLALFHTFKTEQGYLLAAPNEVMRSILPRLKLFVMRAAVHFEPSEHAFLAIQNFPNSVKNTSSIHTAPIKQLTNTTFVYGTTEALSKLWGDVSASHITGDHRDWTELEIRQGLSQINHDNTEKLIPQQINLDLLGGVNFKKGCFPGQEIIARIRYLGKPKSRMIAIKSQTLANIASSVMIEGKDNAAGCVVNSVIDRSGQALASITVPLTHIEQGKLNIDNTNISARLPLPYLIPETKEMN